MTSLSERIADEVAVEWDEAWRAFTRNPVERLALADEARVKARRILAIVVESYPLLDDLAAMLLLQVLQELGQGYALMSEAWPMEAEAIPSMPHRAVVERTVRFAGEHVVAIELITPVSGGDNRGDARPVQMPPPAERKLAHDLATQFRGYSRFLAIVGNDRGRAEYLKRGFQSRRNQCKTMSLGRRLFDLLGALPDRGGAIRQAVLLGLLLTDSQFLAATVESVDDYRDMPVLPIDFVKEYVRSTDVGAWLAHHGAQLSDELR